MVCHERCLLVQQFSYKMVCLLVSFIMGKYISVGAIILILNKNDSELQEEFIFFYAP